MALFELRTYTLYVGKMGFKRPPPRGLVSRTTRLGRCFIWHLRQMPWSLPLSLRIYENRKRRAGDRR